MTERESAHLDGTPTGAAKGLVQPNRYAITLAALVAGAQVPIAEQVQTQPAGPLHDFSVGFHTGAGDLDSGGDDGD